MKPHRRRQHLHRIRSRFLNLFRHPLFWALTIAGNSAVVLGGCALYYFEATLQPVELGRFDAILWALGMMTTVGYGAWTPISLGGKVMVGLLMLGGTLFVWSYMALLVTGLITPELQSLESDVHAFEKDLQDLRAAKNEN